MSEAVVVTQPKGGWACYPSAVYNSLANGSSVARDRVADLPGETDLERVQFLTSEYGSKPSTSYAGTRSRYSVDKGITAEDALELFADALPEAAGFTVRGEYLDRIEGEGWGDHLLRVHGMLNSSLTREFPPVLMFRAFAAKTPQEAEAESWHGLFGHAVALLQIQKSVEAEDAGFWIRFADSTSGKIEHGFVYAERNQNFTATREFELSEDGTLNWNWISDFPYLLAQAPSLSLLTEREPWNVRTTVTLQHAILYAGSAGSPADQGT
jgi:hypothetical protein